VTRCGGRALAQQPRVEAQPATCEADRPIASAWPVTRSRAFARSPLGFGGCFTDRSLLDGDFRARVIDPLVASPERIAGVQRYLAGIDWGIVDDLATEHAKLRAPVLFVWGEDDVTFPIDLARTMVGQIPDCRGLRAVPGASLLVHEEKPDAVAEHALAFYRELRGDRWGQRVRGRQRHQRSSGPE